MGSLRYAVNIDGAVIRARRPPHRHHTAGECERLIATIDDDVRAGRARYDAKLPLIVAIG